MKSNLKYLLIAGFIILWVLFIGWGMIKTGLKLSKETKAPVQKETKPPELKPLSKETKTKDARLSQEPAPAPAPEPAEPGAISVRALKVKPADFNDILPVMGTVKGKTEIELKFENSGIIQKIYFKEGEKIKKGDLIASLDPKDAQLKLAYAKSKFNAAQAAYNSNQKKLEVHKQLYEAGAIIKAKLEEIELECESAKYQVETARSEMELAENELKKTYSYATKDGVMGPRKAEEGEFISTQDKIGSLFEIEEVYVEVGVVERDINKIKIGQKAKVYVDAYPNNAFEGNIDRIYPVVEGKSRTLTAKIKLPNPEGLLFPGMFSRAEIFIVELKNALIAPSTCLIPAGRGITLIPLINKESIEKTEGETQIGTLQLRRVKTGYLTSDYAQILEGLNPEDLIVIEAQGELKDNARVKIVGIEESSL